MEYIEFLNGIEADINLQKALLHKILSNFNYQSIDEKTACLMPLDNKKYVIVLNVIEKKDKNSERPINVETKCYTVEKADKKNMLSIINVASANASLEKDIELFVDNIHVTIDYEGAGIGSLMLKQLELIATRNNCPLILLESLKRYGRDKKNISQRIDVNKQFYEKNGFQEEFALGITEASTAIPMEKKVKKMHIALASKPLIERVKK